MKSTIESRYAHIDPKTIRSMRVMAGNVPCLEVVHGDRQKHEFPLAEGWQIYIANDFLRSLDTGYYISFEDTPIMTNWSECARNGHWSGKRGAWKKSPWKSVSGAHRAPTT